MPKTLSLPSQPHPIWAEASVAVSADGEPNPAVWGKEPTRIHEILTTPADNPIYFNGKIVRYQNEQSAPGCRDVGTTYLDYPEPRRRGTVDEAIADSAVAVLGRVTDKAYGFSSGQPGQLFQIEPVRSYGYPLTKARYYFFVPVGRFTVGGVTICKTDGRYAEPPDVGSEVFLFVGKPEDTTGVFFFVYSAGDVVPVDPDGSLRLPPQYTGNEQQGTAPRASALRTRSDLLARIGRALRSNGELTTYDVSFVPAQPPASASSANERTPDALVGVRPKPVTGFMGAQHGAFGSLRLGGAPAVPGGDSAVHWK